MAEPLHATHPLEPWRAALAELTWAVDGLVVKPEDPVAATDLRTAPTGPGAEAVEHALGSPLPVQPGTWTATADGQVIWLGPDEWLVTSGTSRPHELEEALRKVVAEHGGAAVDVTAQRTTIR